MSLDELNRINAEGEAAADLERALERVAVAWVEEPLLVEEIRRDPVPVASRRNSHLYVIAQPTVEFQATLPDGALIGALRDTAGRVPRAGDVFPGWKQLTRREPRPDGTVGFSGPALHQRRFQTDVGEERALIDVEIAASGRVSLFSGRASDRHTPTGIDVLLDGAVVTLTRSVATLAGLIGSAIGFSGRWRMAVALSDVAGRSSVSALHQNPSHESTPLTSSGYARATETTTAELLDHPEQPTLRLTGPLLRALGMSHEDRLRPDRSSRNS